MEDMGEEMEKEYHAHLPMSNLKSKIRSMQKEYIKERDKRHTQDEVNDLTSRIDTLTQVLKLFPE
jgi:signal transduction histidine kinase